MMFVSGSAVRATLDWSACVEALAVAYGPGIEDSVLPPRAVASTPAGNWMRVLPALPGVGDHFGLKVMGGRRGSTPAAHYLIVLFDKARGEIVAFVDAKAVTGIRTAATSALAARRLAPGGPLRLGVLGSGLEARMHARALVSTLDIAEVTVFSTTPARRQAFAEELTAELGVPVRAADSNTAAVRDAELVVAAARSHDERPIVSAADLTNCRTLISVGSTVPSQREIDTDVISLADLIVCDVVDEATTEAGDFLAATAAGIEFKAHSLADLVSGLCAPAGFSLFKSVGSGLQDIAVASVALRQARDAGLTTSLPIAFD